MMECTLPRWVAERKGGQKYCTRSWEEMFAVKLNRLYPPQFSRSYPLKCLEVETSLMHRESGPSCMPVAYW
jgi:hypothetical protein